MPVKSRVVRKSTVRRKIVKLDHHHDIRPHDIAAFTQAILCSGARSFPLTNLFSWLCMDQSLKNEELATDILKLFSWKPDKSVDKADMWHYHGPQEITLLKSEKP